MRVGDILGGIVPRYVRDRAEEVLRPKTENWTETKEGYARMMPDIHLQPEDLLWNADVLGEIESCYARCANCDTSHWTRGKGGSSCGRPLVPVVSRLKAKRTSAERPIARLETRWIPCAIYREWARTEDADRAKSPTRQWK